MAKKIYIIHGWTYSLEPWNRVVEALKKSGVEVEQLRVPGLTEKSDKVWSIDDYVEWLRSELKGVDKPIVLGHSNGGRIALNYLSKYPGSFSHLILLNSAGVYDNSLGLRLKRSVLRVLSKILKPLKYIPLVKKVVYRLIGAGDYNQAPDNMKKTLSNMIESDRRLDLAKIDVPTTLFWGLKDRSTPIEQGRQMKKLIHSASIKEYDTWAHSPHITAPLELTDAIVDVLEEF